METKIENQIAEFELSTGCEQWQKLRSRENFIWKRNFKVGKISLAWKPFECQNIEDFMSLNSVCYLLSKF